MNFRRGKGYEFQEAEKTSKSFRRNRGGLVLVFEGERGSIQRGG